MDYYVLVDGGSYTRAYIIVFSLDLYFFFISFGLRMEGCGHVLHSFGLSRFV